jgi:predicted nucleic acid-binding protein
VKFWDSSALITLLVEEPRSGETVSLAEKDGAIAAWWGSSVECASAFARIRREGRLTVEEEDGLRAALARLTEVWTEIEPTSDLRSAAERVLSIHPLRAADSLQLAAALIWSGRNPAGQEFVCLDDRLRLAARKEGFTVLPATS